MIIKTIKTSPQKVEAMNPTLALEATPSLPLSRDMLRNDGCSFQKGSSEEKL